MRWLLYLLLAALVQVVSTAPATGQETSEPSLAELKGADLSLLSDVRAIGDRVAKLRGQAFDKPPLAVRVPESMREVAAEIRAYSVLPPERLDARGRAWADIGLGDAGTPRRLLLALARDLGGIGFDPQGNRLLVGTQLLSVEDFEPDGNADDPATVLMMTGVRPDEPLVGHLLMHVRQRERTGGDALRPTTDAMLAGMAWAEGEANLLAVRYLFEGVGLSEDLFEHRVDPGGFLDGVLLPPAMDERPAVERDLLEFVYLDGFDLAVAEFRSGGWAALDRAMANRGTTRQMLHPEKGAAATEFPEPDPPASPGLRLVDQDVVGEEAIVVLIAQGSGKDNLGMIAGDGWAGDRLDRWETDRGDDGGITEWITRWDSAQAAADFSYSFARALAARFPQAPAIDPGRRRLRLEAEGRVFLVETAESEVRVLVAQGAWTDRLPPRAAAPAEPTPDRP